MHISPEQLAKFRKLYKQTFGVELSQEDAIEMANALLFLVKLGTDEVQSDQPEKP